MQQQPGPERGHVPPRHGGQADKPPPAVRNRDTQPPAIVNVKHLSEMEELAGTKSEEGWAGASGEVDYSEKLVFSDEEDESPKKRGDKGSKSSARDVPKEGKDGRLEEDYNRRSPMTGDSGHHGPPRTAWEANEREGGAPPQMPRGPHPHHGRAPPNMDQTGHQRPTVDEEDERWNHQRQKQSSEMSSNIERARQRRLEEQRREEERRQAAAKEKLRQLDERVAHQRPKDGEAEGTSSAPSSMAAPSGPREVQRMDSSHELPKENAEREPDSRDREWDRDRERHKERDLEREWSRERGDVPFSREGMVIKRQRTESGSSDGSRQGRDRRDGGNYTRPPTRNLPPRLLKQQQQQQEQQHRRPPSFSSQDQTWYGRDGSRGSWGGSGPNTPTTPPFGQENRQFNPPTRFHLQRRRESSETSLDGPDRGVIPPEGKDGLREGDVAAGQAALPSRSEADEKSRGNDRGYRNQRIPSDGQPKEIPRRQDSHKEIPRAPRQDTRPDQRQEHWQEHKQDQRPDQKQEHRPDQRQDRRPDQRPDRRLDQRQDNRSDQRRDQRQEQRQDQKPDQRQEQRHVARQDSRQEPKQEGKQEPKLPARQESQQDTRQESKPEKKTEGWEKHKMDQSVGRERHSVQSEVTPIDTRQSVPPKGSGEPRVETKPESENPVQEKKEAKEVPQQGEKDKDVGSVVERKDDTAEPPKTSKASSVNDRDRRPQRDSKAVPSSLVDMKSGNRDKLERNDRSDRHEKGKRRDNDRDDKSNRRGSNEQSGSRHASQKQSDSRERRKEEVQAPEPSRAWKGGDTSKRLNLKEPSSSSTETSSNQTTAREGKTDNKSSASGKSDTSKAHIEEQKPGTEAASGKEPREIHNEKGDKKEKTEDKESGTKPKDVSNDRLRERDRSTRDRRDDKDGRDRGGRMSGRGRGFLDTNRRREDRGVPSRKDDRAPPPGRKDRGGGRGRGYKTSYSTGMRGRGRGRGERYDRQSYRRPRQRDEEEEDWVPSSEDESAEKAPEGKEALKQNRPSEARNAVEGNDTNCHIEEKPRGRESEAKGDSNAKESSEVYDSEKDSLDRRNVPRGEPSRRGRGGSINRRGRGGSGRGGATRDQGRDSYIRDGRDDRRSSSSHDASQRYDRGPRNDGETREYREFKGRGREEEDNRLRSNQREGPPGRGGFKNKKSKPERPPRFQKNSRGRGRVRSTRGDRVPDGPSNRGREPGDMNQVSSANASDAPKGATRPSLPRQNSSDLNNDEWETASESSNFNDHRQRDKEVSQEGPKSGSDKPIRESSGSNVRSSGNPDNRNRNDRRDSRKGPTNQRQGGDRSNNRDRSDYDRREKSYRGGRDNRPGSRGGRGRGSERRPDNGPIGKRHSGPKGGPEQAQNQNHSSDVYRMDQIVLDDHRGVQDALNACTMRPKKAPMPMGKPLDSTTPVTLPLQTKEKEKPRPAPEKKNVLAHYDINTNYGVVVVDDVPEVIVENPEELLTPDAGFQPVLSRKQKAAESERKKQETLSEIGKRGKLGTPMKRITKLPPRLRGQSPLKENIKEPVAVAPIGTGPRMGTLNKAPGTKPINTDNIPPLIGPGSTPAMPIVPPPSLRKGGVESVPLAPPPQSNAWEKPPLLTGPQPQVTAVPAPVSIPASKAAGVPGKPETSDQHDSGVELNSDHHASNPPSQRSSPNGEAKAEARLVSELMSNVGQQPKHSQLTSQPDWSTDMTAPSRLTAMGLQSVSEVAVSSHGQSFIPVSGSMMGRMDGAVTQAEESGMRTLSVDMPGSAAVIGPNSLLSQSVPPHGSPSGRLGQSSIIQSSQDQNRSNVQSPTSTAATDELSMKIESAKNLWDEQEENAPQAPQTSLSNGKLSSQALSSMATVTPSEQQQQQQPQQQHLTRSDKGHDMSAMGDRSSSHLGHPANSMLPVSGTSDITFGSFASSNVELVENDAPTSVSFTNLNTNMSSNMDSDDMEINVPSSRAFAQFSSANTEVESPPEAFTSAGYSSKGLSLYTSATTGSTFASGALLQSSILGQSAYDAKQVGADQTRMHQQSQQQQEQPYQQSVLLAQPFNLGSSLTNNLAGSAVGIPGGSLGGTSQSMLSQGTSGQYSFQGHDTSRLIPASPAFLNPVSFQGTIIQPPSGSLQFGLNQNTGLAPSSPAPGAAPSQQTHQSYQQAAAAGFLPAQTPQPAPSGLPTNFGPILSVSLSQPHVQNHSYLSLSSPSYTRPSHDLGLSSGLTTSVIMKPQSTMGGLTKTVSSVAFGSVSTVPAVQPSHIFSQQRATSQLGAQQPGVLTNNTLIAAAMQPSATPAVAAPAHHPTQGQHTSFFSGGAQVAAAAAAANSQVGSTNFFNTLQGSRSNNLQASVQTIQPLPIQLPQSTISSQYPIAAPQSQTTQPIVHPIGAPLGGYINTYGDIGTQPKQLPRNLPSVFGVERQSSTSILDMTSDFLSRGSDTSVSRSSNLSQHVDAKPFSPNRQTSSSTSSTYGAYKSQDDQYGSYTSRSSGYKSHDQGVASKGSSYISAHLTIGHYNMDDRKDFSQHKTTATAFNQPKTSAVTFSQPKSMTPSYSQPKAVSESPRSSVTEAVSQLKVAESASVPASASSSQQSSLPFSISTTTVNTTTASMSQKPVYTQASKVGQSHPSSSSHKQTAASTKTTTASTPPALQQSLPPRAFAVKSGSNSPRMPLQILGPPNPRMMSHMIGIHGQQIRYPQFPQGPPPPRGTQFGPPPRLPTGNASLNLSSGPSPPNPQSIVTSQKNSQAGSKGQSQAQTSSASQSSSTQSKPSSTSQGGYQANKSKSLQGLPGPGKLTKAPSHFSRRAPIDLKMTPEELKAAQNKERENLLASTKAFFSKPEGDSKEKSENK